MPIVSITSLLKDAEKHGYAIPAFNAYNSETVVSILRTAQKLSAPVIVQAYTRLFQSYDAISIAACTNTIAGVLDIPIALHLDHGAGRAEVMRAIRYGYGSVMIDGSALDFKDNVAMTKEIVHWCNYLNMDVEGELGNVGLASDQINLDEFTRPEEAAKFVELTGVKMLAVMVGSAHGVYKKTPKLDIKRIADIKKVTDAYLVLHGGSGIPDEEIMSAIKAGIRKINVATDVCRSFYKGFQDRQADDEFFSKALDIFMKDSLLKVDEFVENRIRIFGAAGRC